MTIPLLAAWLCLSVPSLVDDPPAPVPGWALSCWAGEQLVRGHAPAAALDVPAGGRVHRDLPAGAFGASFSAELAVQPGVALRFELDARGGTANLRVRDARQQDLAAADAADGVPGATGWFTPGGDRLALEIVFAGGADGATLSLALEPADADPGLAGCVVPEVFVDEALRAMAAQVALSEADADPAAADDASADDDDGPPRVLFLTQSAGFEHGVVKRDAAGGSSHAERQLTAAMGNSYRLRCTQDARELPAALDDLDAVVFYTTGELPLSTAERQRLLDWVADGGAFIGVHCASDTMYASPDYLEMLGGTFDGHPWHEEVTLRVERPDHPAVAHLAPHWSLTDEIYQFRAFRRFPNAVLLSLDGASADLSLGKRADGDYANAWVKPWGRGRVFYTALGHRPELWEDEGYLRHLLGGIDWALAGPDLPVPPPKGARVLLGPGVTHAAWVQRDGAPFAWSLREGVLVPREGAGDLVSREAFGDALIHVEFQLPESANGHGNSGVYVAGVYELQVIDDASDALPPESRCGAVYGLAAPAHDASRAAGAWQTFDIRYRAPRFDASGARSEAARLSVWLNGIPVHVDRELPGPTPGGLREVESPVGPLLLQDHGDPVNYRNLWVVPQGG